MFKNINFIKDNSNKTKWGGKAMRTLLTNNKKRAQASMGTIIVFIAMIFVATIAAGVIIQTTTSLGSSALKTGSAARKSVAENILIRNIYGENASDDSIIETLFITLQPGGATSGFDLDDISVSIINPVAGETREYQYNAIVSSCDNTVGANQFNVEYIINGTAHQDGLLVPGDIAKVCFNTFNIIESSTSLVTIRPGKGAPTSLEFVAPQSMFAKTVDLYP